MTGKTYVPDDATTPADIMILAGAGPEPTFDAVMTDFLQEGYTELKRRCEGEGLLEFASLGRMVPWLFRLTFGTRGFVQHRPGQIVPVDRHVVALRFPYDYLRCADRFGMLRLLEPLPGIFHPNIAPNGAICVEVYPGESLVEICQSLHELFRWRLRQYDERDALNPLACAWGRENVDVPVDDRPLFGRRLRIEWQASSAK